MQLVLSNNRVIAYGENFLATGDAVSNTKTGEIYENATVAECASCPSDIDSVGYEYHAGVFVPCAPFGAGNNNGYVMEVGTNCATPRNSGLLIRDIKWDKISSAAFNIVDTNTQDFSKNYTFPISESILNKYTILRYRIKAGSYLYLDWTEYEMGRGQSAKTKSLLSVGYENICTLFVPESTTNLNTTYVSLTISFNDDFVSPFNLMNYGGYQADISEGVIANGSAHRSISIGASHLSSQWYTPAGVIVDPLTITLTLPLKPSDDYGNLQYASAKVVVELEGRK